MKESEEKGYINNKKASTNHFTTFGHYNFGQFSFALSFHSLILSYSCTVREILEHAWSTLSFTWIWRKKAMERKKEQGYSWINNYKQIYLQVTSHMCDFLVDFQMHGICMRFYSYVLSLAWIFVQIENGFSLTFPFPRQPLCCQFFHLFFF